MDLKIYIVFYTHPKLLFVPLSYYKNFSIKEQQNSKNITSKQVKIEKNNKDSKTRIDIQHVK